MAADTISFARGAPSLDIVDVDGLKAAAKRAFENDPAGLTGYGTAIGYPPLRQWIADQHQVEPANVIVTNGSMQADAFLFDHLVAPGDPVVVERPTYDRTLLGLRQRGADIRPIELEPDGIDVEGVGRLISDGIRPKLAHVIPNHQNPAGVTLSAPRRDELLALAREYRFTVFEDDPYAEIRFRGTPLPSLLSLDSGRDTVVHASSFTKTVCPGVRVGYLVGSPELIAAIARRATNLYISPNMVSEGIVYQFCVSGDFERSVRTVNIALAERARRLAAALREHLPGVRFTEPDGGYFLWVELPDDVAVDAVVPAAAERGVAVVKGSDFLLDGGQHALRLAYSAVTAEQVDEGVRRLAAAIAAVRNQEG